MVYVRSRESGRHEAVFYVSVSMDEMDYTTWGIKEFGLIIVPKRGGDQLDEACVQHSEGERGTSPSVHVINRIFFL